MIQELIGKKIASIIINLIESKRDEILGELHKFLQDEHLPIPEGLEGPIDDLIEQGITLAFDGILGALKALT